MNEISVAQSEEVGKMRQNAAIPNLDGMTPKQMRMAWDQFLAGHTISDKDLYVKAEYVRLSIGELILNDGTAAELMSQKNLEQRLATFSQAWMQGRG